MLKEINQCRKEQHNCLVQRYMSGKKQDILSTAEWVVVFEVFGRHKSIWKYWYGEGAKGRRKLKTGFESLLYWREETLNLGTTENEETR